MIHYNCIECGRHFEKKESREKIHPTHTVLNNCRQHEADVEIEEVVESSY